MSLLDSKINIELTVNELNKIHGCLSIKIDNCNNIEEINDLMKICKSIEDVTEDYLVWY